MTTEKEFAVGHASFWRTTLPLMESFTRTMNRALARYAVPMSSALPAARRGLVNEAAFQVFAAASASSHPVGELEREALREAWARAVSHVRTMRQFSRTPVDGEPAEGEIAESVALARRIGEFFTGRSFARVVGQPIFKGCGWIDEARADVLADRTLFEVKAGERRFRSVDLHQLLVYCALNFATKAHDINSVALVNPRVGVFAVLDVEELCDECAGRSAADVLDDILDYISEPLASYPG